MSQYVRVLSPFVLAAGLAAAAGQPAPDPAPKLTTEQLGKLKLREKYSAEAVKLARAGKFAEARTWLEKTLAVEIDVFGDVHPDVADSLEWLTDLALNAEEFPAARAYAERAAALREKLHGQTHWKTTDARRLIADVRLRSGLSDEKKADLREAVQLRERFLEQGKRREFADAVKLAERALPLFRSSLGVKHPDYAHCLHYLAFLHQSRGQLARAEPLYKEALEIRKEVLGIKHPDYARTLSNMAVVYHSMRQYAKAESLYLEVLALRKEVFGVKHLDYGASLNNLASLHDEMAQYAKAAPLHWEALAIKKERLGIKNYEYLADLNDLAARYRDLGQYALAAPLFQEALAVRKEMNGVRHPEYVRTLDSLAFAYRSQGQYAKAEPLYREALAIRKEVLGVKNPDYADSLSKLASMYYSLGQYARAEPLHQEALTIRKEVLGVKHPDYVASLNNLAYLYSSLGQYAKAEPLYQEALTIHKEVHGLKDPDAAASLNNLARLYSSMGQHARAETLYQQALDIRKNGLGVRARDYEISLSSLASLYQSQGQYAKAEPLYQEALKNRKEVLGVKHPDYADSLNDLASLYQSQGQYAKAEPLYRQALDLRREALGVKHPDYADSLNDLGYLYKLMGQNARAESMYLEAISIIQAQLEDTAAIQSESDQLSYIGRNRYYLNDLLRLTGTHSDEVHAAVFRWRGAVTARQAFSRAARVGDQSQEVQDTLRRLHDVSQRLSTLVNSPPRAGVNIASDFKKLSGEREDLEKNLAGLSKGFAEYKAYLDLTPADLQRSLAADAVLIDFVDVGNKMAAFIVTREKIVRVDLKGGKELAEMVAAYRSELSLNRTRPVSGEEDASSLYQAVWAPLAPHLGKAKLVLICPDGPLCQLPFAALRGSDPSKYLIEEVAIVVAPVPRLLPQLLARNPRRAGNPSLLAIGDVNFDGDAAFGKADDAPLYATRAGGPQAWKLLPGTRKELEAIAKLFRKAEPDGAFKSLEGDAASEPTVRREMGKYRCLHFATHGFFAPPEPALADEKSMAMTTEGHRRIPVGASPHLRCGLVCAGANKPTADEDGVLTALEIMDLDLSSVELAVLSACETGLGKVENGDGVLGLQRAFQVAGARTTVTSLWKVSDGATAALMTRFYENLWSRRMTALEALREAQIWLLNNGAEAGVQEGPARKGRRTPPLYWAAFTLAGDWR